MYKHQVRLKGTIWDARLLSSVMNYETGDYFHYVDLIPDNRYEGEELERQIEEVKENYLQGLESWELKQLDRSNKDKIISPDQRCAFRFQVKQGMNYDLNLEFKDFINDGQFFMKTANVYGHIQLLKDGNAFLSFRAVDPWEKEMEPEPAGEVDDEF